MLTVLVLAGSLGHCRLRLHHVLGVQIQASFLSLPVPCNCPGLEQRGPRVRCWSLFLNLMTKIEITQEISCRAFLPSTSWSVCFYSSALIRHWDPSSWTSEQISALEVDPLAERMEQQSPPTCVHVCLCACACTHSVGGE